MEPDRAIAIPPHRFRRHDDAEVRAADADVDHVRESRAGEAENPALVHPGHELAHLRQLRANLRHDVMAVGKHRAIGAIAQRHVHGCAAFRVVDPLAGEQRRDARRQVAGQSKRLEQAQRLAGHALAGEVVQEVECADAHRVEATGAVVGEEVTKVAARELRGVRLERLPGRQGGAGCGHPRSLAVRPLRRKRRKR